MHKKRFLLLPNRYIDEQNLIFHKKYAQKLLTNEEIRAIILSVSQG
jgi:hypothetical protein